MTTWRERIAEARERGKFSDHDRWLASASSTCAVGEVCAGAVGYVRYIETALDGEARSAGWTLGTSHSARFTSAVYGNEFDEAESLLDAIEDRALALKRSLSERSEAP